MSTLYGIGVRARLAAYENGLLSTQRLDVPVISVGNITAGGTGKTPLVEFICRALADRGRKVCVLTRGYGREQPKKRVLVSDGYSLKASEKEAGDEAYLLAHKLKGVAAVVSDANRVNAGRWAIKELRIDACVLDDGFQHLQLARDLNILTIDATNPWGGEELLPYGRLREPLEGLRRADCVVITRAEENDFVASQVDQIKSFFPDRPVFTSRMEGTEICKLNLKPADLSTLQRPMAAFCGVGNPESFFELLRSLDLFPATTQTFPDHHRYDQKSVAEIEEQAQLAGANSLITTAKDAVKLQSLQFSMPCYVLEIEIALAEEQRFLSLVADALTYAGAARR